MDLVCLQWRVFLRGRATALPTAVLAATIVGLGGYEIFLSLNYGYRGLDPLSFSGRFSVLWPLLFLVLTYELVDAFRREHMDESMAAAPGASARAHIAALAVPFTILAVLFVAYLMLRIAVLCATRV